MSERWWKIREVLLRARDGESFDWPRMAVPLSICAERGWIEDVEIDGPNLAYPGRITEAGRDAASYMSDAEAFERAFLTCYRHLPPSGAESLVRRGLPEDVPWRELRDRLARERGWT